MLAIERDLQLVPPPYRKPLRRFLWNGVIPCNRDLFTLLCGDGHAGNGDAGLLIVSAYLDKHDASLDIAHGHLGLVLRWQYLGGLEGRQ